MRTIKLSSLLRYSAYGIFLLAVMGGFFFYRHAGFSATVQAPSRPENVPADAVWAGGTEGGAWILCVPTLANQALLSCRMFNDRDGTLWARGTYMPARITWDAAKEAPVTSPAPLPDRWEFEGFDGVALFLKQNITLVPHGTIDYPAPDGHGKRQTYRVGEPHGAEIAY
jgi:hypothetical protein